VSYPRDAGDLHFGLPGWQPLRVSRAVTYRTFAAHVFTGRIPAGRGPQRAPLSRMFRDLPAGPVPDDPAFALFLALLIGGFAGAGPGPDPDLVAARAAVVEPRPAAGGVPNRTTPEQ
jgi:hypothetical protein